MHHNKHSWRPQALIKGPRKVSQPAFPISFTSETKSDAPSKLLERVAEPDGESVAAASYLHMLSVEFSEKLSGKASNHCHPQSPSLGGYGHTIRSSENRLQNRSQGAVGHGEMA